MEEFVAEFEEPSSVNAKWLQDLYRFTEENLLPLVHPGITCKELSSCLFKCLSRVCLYSGNPYCQQGKDGLILPLNYRFISLSELQSQQRSPCCSHLTWSTCQFEEWTLDKENFLVGHTALSRTNLLLCGVLTDKTGITQGTSESAERRSDGNLYLQSKNGFIPCEILNLDPQWLEHLVLLPSWSYIPVSGGGSRHKGIEAGYLEVIEAPSLVLPKQSVGNFVGPKALTVLLPDSAIHLLDKEFPCQRVKLNIAGELCRLSSVLSIRGKTFFFFFLSSFTTDTCLPVVIQVPAKLMWHHCLEVSKKCIITKVFVSGLQGTDYKVFVVSSSSDFYIYTEGLVREQTLAEFMHASDTNRMPYKESFQNRVSMDWSNQSTIEDVYKNKESKIISYHGVISKVLNFRAGLYELDGKLGLCVAYQQLVNYGRGLRPGARVEVFDAHVHVKVSDHLPQIMLCCCLRSTLHVTGFSQLSTEYQPFSPSCNVYISLLFKYNLDLPTYLWLVHVIDTLVQRFCPCFMSRQHMLKCGSDIGVIGTFFSSILNYTKWNLPKTTRDIYQEILAESHHCPVTEISHLNIPCQIPSLAEVLSVAEERAWNSLDVSSLLPDNEIKHLVSSQLNSKLAWSFEVLKPEDFQPQMILNGVFQANSVTGYLQLVDASGSLDCVVQNSAVSQTAFCDTSYIGCLVQLQKYQVVLERFMNSDFPSSKHLRDPRFIKEKHTRVYVQFRAGDVRALGEGARAAGAQPVPAAGASGESGRCSGACRSDEVSGAAANQRRGGPSLPKMPLLEEVVLQEGHVGESGRTGCSHPSWRAGDAAGCAGQERRLRGAGTGAGHPAACGGKRKHSSPGVGCVAHLLVVTHKDALMLRNCQYGRNEGFEHTNGSGEVFSKRTKAGLGLAFCASAFVLGSPRQWEDEGSIEGLPELETDLTLCSEYNNRTQVHLDFVGEAVRWYHLINVGGVYRVIGPKQVGTSVFEQYSSSVPLKTLQSVNCPRSLVVQPDWKFQYISTFSSLRQFPLSEKHTNMPAYLEKLASEMPHLSTIQDILSGSSSASLVSFTGIILERVCLESKRWSNFAAPVTDIDTKGVLVPGGWCLKFTVGQIQNRAMALDVYVDLLKLTYTIGILPGSIVVFRNLERIISRHNNVYCKFVPSSSVSVLELSSLDGKSSLSSAPIAERPFVYLGNLISGQENCQQGIVCCHVVNVHSLKLQWVCSRCSSIFKQGRCTRNSEPCPSADGVFQAYANIIVEDGTAEAWVYCKDKQIAHLLQLGSTEWEGLQQHVAQQGSVYFQYQGRSGHELHEENIGDLLMQYLGVVCASPIVCRSVQLLFKVESRSRRKLKQLESLQVRILKCGDHQYSTKMAPTLSLTCLDIKEVDYRMLCHLGNDRLIQ
ncbi:CST complex subunit CTC1 isoform X1 [Hypanus sabinus]|uniref:CST complex subunit CTC1 isoform X1 n=1 Tax=Hypanus sabinus TaxID=79690 RepID=UPI0028C4A23E|nr:CST complex subunit CTC1 isoform X1 [Hypanus sabinus]